MRYVKKPKYRLNKLKVNIPKEDEASPKDIYEEMLRDKIRKRKRR